MYFFAHSTDGILEVDLRADEPCVHRQTSDFEMVRDDLDVLTHCHVVWTTTSCARIIACPCFVSFFETPCAEMLLIDYLESLRHCSYREAVLGMSVPFEAEWTMLHFMSLSDLLHCVLLMLIHACVDIDVIVHSVCSTM